MIKRKKLSPELTKEEIAVIRVEINATGTKRQ